MFKIVRRLLSLSYSSWTSCFCKCFKAKMQLRNFNFKIILCFWKVKSNFFIDERFPDSEVFIGLISSKSTFFLFGTQSIEIWEADNDFCTAFSLPPTLFFEKKVFSCLIFCHWRFCNHTSNWDDTQFNWFRFKQCLFFL